MWGTYLDFARVFLLEYRSNVCVELQEEFFRELEQVHLSPPQKRGKRNKKDDVSYIVFPYTPRKQSMQDATIHMWGNSRDRYSRGLVPSKTATIGATS